MTTRQEHADRLYMLLRQAERVPPTTVAGAVLVAEEEVAALKYAVHHLGGTTAKVGPPLEAGSARLDPDCMPHDADTVTWSVVFELEGGTPFVKFFHTVEHAFEFAATVRTGTVPIIRARF